MATYEDLRFYFEQSKFLQEIVRGAAAIPIVTGVTINVDPLWSWLYDIEHHLVDAALPPSWPPDSYVWPDHAGAERGYRRRDLDVQVKGWDEINHPDRRARLPVLLTIVHRALRGPSTGRPDDDDDIANLQRLVQLVQAAPVWVRLEEREPARLAVVGGDRILARSHSGTLGGVLEDASAGVSYGVTCGHVAQKGDVVSDSTGTPIGTCIDDTTRYALAAPKVCDPVTLVAPSRIPGNGPDLNMLDAALIELTRPPVPAALAGVAKALSPGQSVSFVGAVTGSSRHALGSLCLSYSFSDGTQDFCFRDAIELLPQPSGVLGRITVPKQGDSGGWVLTNSSPPDWAGMLFGADSKRGFLIRANWVHHWAEGVVGTTLQC